MLNDKIELQKRDREFARWMILRMLYAGRPGGISEIVILRVLQSLDFVCELDHVRQDIDYMQSIGLAEAGWDGMTGCWARLTALGIAVVEYNEHAPSDIGRPRRGRSSKK
jgi:hypothetical protein